VEKIGIGVTAGASAPEVLVRAVIARLNQLGVGTVSNLEGAQEKVAFALPKDWAFESGSARQATAATDKPETRLD